jgi:hypothetical protein
MIVTSPGEGRGNGPSRALDAASRGGFEPPSTAAGALALDQICVID